MSETSMQKNLDENVFNFIAVCFTTQYFGMKKLLLLLFFAQLNVSAFADMGPKLKFNPSIFITFYQSGKLIQKFDSICMIVNQSDTTLAERHHWGDPEASLEKVERGYKLTEYNGELNNFTIILFINGKKIQSPIINRYYGDSIYKIDVEGNQLIDNSQLFHSEWYIYFFALFCTIIIELVIAFRFFDKDVSINLRTSRFLVSFIAINILTHFSLWYVYSHFNISILFLELFVCIIETIYWMLFMKRISFDGFNVAFFTNGASWIIGGIISLAA